MSNLYEYICPTGHVIEHWAPITKIPKRIKCKACGKYAIKVFSLPGPPIVEGGTPRFYRKK